MLTTAEVVALLGMEEALLCAPELATINGSIAAYMTALRNYTGRWLTLSSWVDTFYHTNGIMLGEYPVATVASVIVNGVTIPSTDYVIDKDTGILYYLSDGFPQQDFFGYFGQSPFYAQSSWTGNRADTAVITYTAGYDPFPADLTMLLSSFVLDRLNALRIQSSGGIQSLVSGNLRSVTVEGVGQVAFQESGSSFASGYSKASAALGGPIFGAGIEVIQAYRDIHKFVKPSNHSLISVRTA